jgi:hypothetical protein
VGTISAVPAQRSFHILVSLLLLAALPGCAMFRSTKSSDLAGLWVNSVATVWTINANGTFEVDLTTDGQRDTWGKYKIDGDTLTLVATGGMTPKGCRDKGVYHFKRSDDTLSFALVSDNCRLRRKSVLQIWHLKK